MKNAAVLPILESVMAEEREDPMVWHEVSRCSFAYRRIHAASCVHIAQAAEAMGCYFLDLLFSRTLQVSERQEPFGA